MAKTIIKEVIITLLLCVAILLILSVLFYDYNPINKVVPNAVAYSTPNDIYEELQEEVTELEKTNIVYTIQGSDLNKYINSKNYVKGKANPFESTSTSVSDGEMNTQGGTNTTNGGTSGNNTGTFWNDTGTK